MSTLANAKTYFVDFFGPKKTSITCVLKLKCSRETRTDFCLVRNLTIREPDFKRFGRLRNQLFLAADTIAREDNLSPVLTPTMSKDVNEQLKLAHQVIDVVDRANRKICVTLLRYNMDKPLSSHTQIRIFARKKESEKLQQFVFVNYKFEEIICLLDAKNS